MSSSEKSIMNGRGKLTITLLSLLLAGCATYESQPVYTTTTITGYSYGAAPYYAPPVYYVEPAPVYVRPAPVYVVPRPYFGAQIHGSYVDRHAHPPHPRHDNRPRPRPRDKNFGNAGDARIGGPGWTGSVWSR